MKGLLETVGKFDGGHFDESSMFANKMEGISLKEEFKQKFRNISRIMDCVGCDKCKLWGKIQITGLGMALKKLTRSEIVALFNAFGQISNSIEYVQMFKDL